MSPEEMTSKELLNKMFERYLEQVDQTLMDRVVCEIILFGAPTEETYREFQSQLNHLVAGKLKK